MIVKALAPFTAFTGEMIVFNLGDVRDLPDDVAANYIASGLAEQAKAPKAKADEAPASEVAP